MTREEVIAMAKKAELHCHMNLTEHSLAIDIYRATVEDLEHFAALVRDDVFNKHTPASRSSSWSALIRA